MCAQASRNALSEHSEVVFFLNRIKYTIQDYVHIFNSLVLPDFMGRPIVIDQSRRGRRNFRVLVPQPGR